MVGRATDTSDDLYERFLGDVLSGAIRPEQRLGEVSLANRWDAGRAAVRELLYRLEQDGLVHRKRRSGTYLRTIDIDEVLEIYDIRIACEGLMAPYVAKRITDQQLEEMAELANTLDSMPGPTAQRLLADQDFHMRLHEISALPNLPRLLRTFRSHILCAKLNHIIWRLGPGTMAQLDHRGIIEVLRQRDPAASTTVFREHVLTAKNHLLEVAAKMAGQKFSPQFWNTTKSAG